MSLSSVRDGAQELKISGTASAIAFRLADDIPADHIHLNASATRLVQTDTEVTVYTGYPGVEGPVIQAEYAILAIPPSQAGHIKYEPEMPFERVKVVFWFSGLYMNQPCYLRALMWHLCN